MFPGCADDFPCANQSRLVNGVDDAKEFGTTRRALSLLGEHLEESVRWVSEFRTRLILFNVQTFLPVLGMSEREQRAIFQTLAAILHLCNVQVKSQSVDQSRVPVSFFSLALRSSLSGPV